MATWTKKTTEITPIDKTTFSFTVEFYKDDKLFDTYTEPRVSDASSIDMLIFNRYNQIQKIDSLNVQVDTDPVPIPVIAGPPPPTQHELDVLEYARQKAKVASAADDLALKIITQGEYDAILAAFKALTPPS